MRKAVPAGRRLAVPLYYLIASTAEYGAVAHLVCVFRFFFMHMVKVVYQQKIGEFLKLKNFL